MKILSADDSRMVRSIVKRSFAEFGAEVIEAANGKEAWDRTLEHTFDLLVLDVTMPEMDGLAALEEIRKNPATAETPVIMLTAECAHATLERADALKVGGYIVKPFKGDQLVEVASSLISLPQPH